MNSILDSASSSWTGRMLSVLRVVAALLLMQHGMQKMISFPVPTTPPMPYVLTSLNGVAGILETFGGLALLLGLLTRPIAFLLSGEMAVAYLLVHARQGFWPIANHGELAVVLSFLFLYFAFAGGGRWSVDAALRRASRHEARAPAPEEARAKRAA